MKRIVFRTLSISLIASLMLVGCNQNKVKDAPVSQEQTIDNGGSHEEKVSNEDKILQEEEIVNKGQAGEALVSEENLSEEQEIQQVAIVEMNNEAYFDGIKGCMVIYDGVTNEYLIYNKDLVNGQSSPYSTFKIISALIGLEEGVLLSSESTMGYDGTRYPMDSWNHDLTLEEAFKNSCVWYFRKVIDQIGIEKMTQYVKALHYGNEDVSEWKGKDTNSLASLNGFWLGSSLKISPKEQVEVLHTIFEEETSFSAENKEQVKKIMYVDTINQYEVYGKTGTGNDKAWFVGFFQDKDKTYYFATQLEDGQANGISGYQARNITYKVIEQFNKEEKVE